MELIKELNKNVIEFENSIIDIQHKIKHNRVLDTLVNIEYKHTLLKQYKTITVLYNKAIQYNYNNTIITEFLQYTHNLIEQFKSILKLIETIVYT